LGEKLKKGRRRKEVAGEEIGRKEGRKGQKLDKKYDNFFLLRPAELSEIFQGDKRSRKHLAPFPMQKNES